jgi:UDP-glucose:(heptosyl)LPS alpha-1,3-glucosyltransferase
VKLAIVCRPLSAQGGVETATAGLLGELSRRGHEIDLLTTGLREGVPGVRVRRLPVLPQPSSIRLLSFAILARRALAGRGYDIVQSHERGLRQDIYRAGEGTHQGYLAAIGRQRRARLDPHHRLLCALERRIFRLQSARHVVAIARAGKAEIERLYGTPPDRVSVVYNGVDLSRFHPENRSRFGRAVREALGVSGEAWVILFIGSGFERKGLDVLLDAVARIGDRRCRVLVAGKGEIGRYQELAARLGLGERVAWLGPRRDPERLYAAADVVALPARYEPFGNVHLEALAAGVPVLTTALAGGSEVIAQGRNGWVVASPAGEPIAEGLAALRACDPGELSQRARESANPFTYAAQADGFETLYGQLKR